MSLHSFPLLLGESKNGKTKEWRIYIEENKVAQTITIVTQTGYVDGKKVLHRKDIQSGKNIGKVNETTPLEQAMAEALSTWKDKIKRGGYKPEPGVMETLMEEEEELEEQETNVGSSSSSTAVVQPSMMYPMLAQKWTDKKKIEPNTFVQPKLDGVRCMMKFIPEKKEVLCLSRTGQPYHHLNLIRQAIQDFFQHVKIQYWMKKHGSSFWLDGELYRHDMPFQKITSIVRKKKKEDTEADQLQYHIYDIYFENHPDWNFQERAQHLQSFATLFQHPNIQWVDTKMIQPDANLLTLHNEYVEKGYEGMMIRYPNGMYRPKYRSNELLKYKMFEDDEYTIVDYKESAGIPGTIQFICSYTNSVNGETQTFTTDMKGPFEWRGQLFEDAKKHFDKKMKGKPLTVQHQGFTDSGAPRFPKGKSIRDYE